MSKLFVLFSLWLGVFSAFQAMAESSAEASLNRLITDVDAAQAQLDETETLEIDAAKQTIKALKSARERTQKVDAFVQEAAVATQTIETFRSKIADLDSQDSSKDWSSTPIDQLNTTLITISAQQNALIDELTDLKAKQLQLSTRSKTIADELVLARDRTTDSRVDTNNESSTIFALSQQADAFISNLRITNLERELNTLPERQRLLEANVDWLVEKIDNNRDILTQLQSTLAAKQSSKMQALLDQAQAQVKSVDGIARLDALAKENLALAQRLREMTLYSSSAQNNVLNWRTQLLELSQAKQTIERVIATGQVTDELGVLLRQLQVGLPKLAPLRERDYDIDKMLVQEQLDLILWQNRLEKLKDYEPKSTALLPDSARRPPITDEQLDVAKNILEQRKQLLQELVFTAKKQQEPLSNEKQQLNQLINQIIELNELLDRHLLWLPSSTDATEHTVSHILFSLSWLLSPSDWWLISQNILDGLKKPHIWSWLLLVLACVLTLARARFRSRLAQLSKRVGNVGKDAYWVTPLALVITFLLALPVPVVIGVASGLVDFQSRDGSFAANISTGLVTVSSLALVLLTFSGMCRRFGLFESHFGWSTSARQKLRRSLWWFSWLQIITAFLFTVGVVSDQMELRYGLAMIAFVVSSLGISLFNYQLFNKKRGTLRTLFEATRYKKRLLLAGPLLIILPSLIGILPFIGFFDTAVELQSRLFQSGIALVLACVVYGLLLRMFLVAYRRFQLRQLRKRRAKECNRNEEPLTNTSGDAQPLNEEAAHVVSNINNQTRAILFSSTALFFVACLWFIWQSLLPALGVFNDIVLWETKKVIDGVAQVSQVTLWGIMLSVLFIIGGFIAAKNIRGILEVGLFERLKLDAGARYATVAIAGYVLVGTGLILGLSQWGIDWSKLQWIVAALGVGLGFGLQEIVANFISGLIILFERPVRVGDTVTIGDLSGTVSNIKIRATTITDFDNREVLLPNKSIITENVTNWTLHDPVTRVIIMIGVAYGSNIDQVHGLLKNIIENHKDVLPNPPPAVFFTNHGESSLDFEIRVFVDAPIKRFPVTHDINSKINQVLAEHSIEIPFPQRDVHIIPPKQEPESPA